MVMIGTDSHKRTHTVIALDEIGRRLGIKTVRTNSEEWCAQFADHDEEGVRFALEDCRHLTRRLESDLLAAGQRVVRVPTRLMAGARREDGEVGSDRRRGRGAGGAGVAEDHRRGPSTAARTAAATSSLLAVPSMG